MNGFLKLLANEFDGFNAEATAFTQVLDPTITSYTYYLLDNNPLYVWARIENNYFGQLSAPNQLSVLSEQAAISQGMIVPGGE